MQEQQDRNDLAATKAINSETASNAATAAVNQAVLADGTRAMTGNLNANSNKVVNLANPTAGGDAVNKTFADATYQPLDAELTELATMASNTAAALADLTQAEVNILDGATVSTSELNTLDGVTASTAELNKLDGVTSSTAELNILDGVTATASELNALDGITASTAELNKLDGLTTSTAELNTVDGVTSAIQTQLDGKQPLDAELTELATMQSTTASALADLIQAEVQILDGATLSTAELNTLDGITSTTTELNVLDGVTATTTELNVTDGLTASTSELNQLDGKTISSTLTPANANDIPTSSAVNTFVSGLLNALGGFVAIPNETSFPTTNPDPSDNAGTVVSIADAGGVVVDASGVSTTGRTTGNVTVTINGFPSSLQSTTLGAGLGLQVQTTTTLNTYTYHKLIAKETDVVQLSDDINDFNARYRVSNNAPTTDLDEGDLWYDKTANKMKVYDTSTSAWKEVQSVGNSLSTRCRYRVAQAVGSATFNGSAYRFTLSNAGANAQQMLVSVNGVIQKPNSGTSQPSEGFAIDNNDIIFAAAPASGASHFIVTIGSTVNIGQPSNNTVDTSELVDGAVTNAKVSSSAAIAGTKISPNFGSQNIVTTGSAGIGETSVQSTLHVAKNIADSDAISWANSQLSVATPIAETALLIEQQFILLHTAVTITMHHLQFLLQREQTVHQRSSFLQTQAATLLDKFSHMSGCVSTALAKFILAILVHLQQPVTSIKQQAVIMSWILLQVGPQLQTEVFDFLKIKFRVNAYRQLGQLRGSALRVLVKLSLPEETSSLRPIPQQPILDKLFIGNQLQVAGPAQVLMLPFMANELMVATVI